MENEQELKVQITTKFKKFSLFSIFPTSRDPTGIINTSHSAIIYSFLSILASATLPSTNMNVTHYAHDCHGSKSPTYTYQFPMKKGIGKSSKSFTIPMDVPGRERYLILRNRGKITSQRNKKYL